MRRGFFLIMLFTFLGLPSFVLAETITISRPISSDTTWLASNVYIIDSYFSVLAGATLTIEPGTIIKEKVTDYNYVSIYGKIIAHGTSTAPIYFTSFRDDSVGGDTNNDGPSVGEHAQWQGLYFKPGSEGSFDYVNISYAGMGGDGNGHYVGIENDGGTLNIQHSNIHDNYTIGSDGGSGIMSVGSGIYNKSGTLSVTNSVIDNNVWGIRVDSGTATISGNVIKNNGDSTGYGSGYGVYVAGHEPLTLLNNTFSDNRRTAYVDASKNFTHSGNTSEDLDYKGFQMGGIISNDTTFTSGDLPYIVQGLTVSNGKTLTLEPGTILKMDDYYSTGSIYVQGNLIAKGTPEKKIYITSLKDDSVGGDTNGDGSATAPSAQDWSSFTFEAGSKVDFDNVVISYGGYKNTSGWLGGISAVIYDLGADFSMTNSFIGHNYGDGIFQGTGSTTIYHSEIADNNQGIQFRGGTMNISQSSFNNKTSMAIWNQSGLDVGWGWEIQPLQIIDARNNWWGDASGPHNLYDPASVGTGGSISNNVDYIPFLTAPPSETPPLPPIAECCSNILFLPGLEASRLYKPDYNGGTENLWEPTGDDESTRSLFMDAEGIPTREDIYVRGVIDNAYLLVKGNVYKSFLEQLSTMKNTDKIIADYSVAPYDWRLSLDDILNNGAEYSNGRLYYAGPNGETGTPYIIQELRRLAGSSRTGKVTIIAHSNGGLVTKALTDKLGAEASDLIDKIIFVAVPQVGTPEAVGAILHGFNQSLPISALSSLGIKESTAREFAQNMPSAYNLLPSSQYFTYVDDPVITFDNDPLLAEWRQKYGVDIHSAERLRNFITDQTRTTLPTSEDLKSPIIGNASLLNKAELVHENLDNWIPPAGISLTEIAGWGEETLKTIVYYQGIKTTCDVPGDIHTCHDAPALEYSPETVIDGDGTVIVSSALWTPVSTGVKKYWVDLKQYNSSGLYRSIINRKHADIFEVPGLRMLVENIIIGNENILPGYVYKSSPPNYDPTTQLRFTLHSPLSIDLYDDLGNHTGFSTTTNSLEENIPGSRYLTFGEVKYISVPESSNIHLIMNGYTTGSFILDLAEVSGDTTLASTTFSGIPTIEGTLVKMDIPQNGGIVGASNLKIDMQGDGKTDYELKPKLSSTVILPKLLIVTASSTTIKLGSQIPRFTVSFSGFVDGDGDTETNNDITGIPNCTTTATTSSLVGTYPITCSIGTLSSEKYEFDTFISGKLTIQYKWDGFLQPINDTAHEIGQSLSVFKSGSTIPVKLQLKKSDGTVVQAKTAPVWLAPQKGSMMTAAIDESVYSDPVTSNNVFKWDAINQQYVYNWSTKGLASGYWYRIFVQLDDGTKYSVTIGLK